MIVADGLGDILGRRYYHDTLPPLQARLEDIRQRFPLS